ncbi:MAG: efflux RND transporter periplasmic adaptor subunit [Patescibacteria group bacterium]|mgnify:CR=1 FL=1
MKNKKLLWTGIAVVVIILLAIFFFTRNTNSDAGAFTVAKTDLLERVSVIGKVKANQKADLAFKQSGFIVAVERAVGEQVPAGSVLARLDSRDAVQAVNDAQAALETAQVDLAKLEHPSTGQFVTNKLDKARQDGLSVLVRVFGEAGDILDSVNHTFFDSDFTSSTIGGDNLTYYATVVSSYETKFRSVPSTAKQQYNILKNNYAKLFALYQQRDQANVTDTVLDEKIITDTHQVLKQLSELIKLGRDLVQYFHDKSVSGDWTSLQADLVAEQWARLGTQLQTINSYVAELGAITSTISQERLNSSTNNFSLESQAVVVNEKKNSLQNAQAKLADYAIRAPFSGIVTKQEARVGEFATAGTALVGLITDGQLIVEANVPEVDIAKVKLSDKATVLLDAYGDAAKFEATVTAIDPAETILEGVPTYKITLTFAESDARIRSGMTANIELVTGQRAQVLAVPTRAIKFVGAEAMVTRQNANGENEEVKVTTGLRASDGQVEIVSGLNLGDEIVLP